MHALTSSIPRFFQSASLWAILTLGAMASVTACGDTQEDPVTASDEGQKFVLPTDEGNWILVDQIHSTLQNPDLKLERNNYNYQGMHGYHRLFKHFERHGYPYSQLVHTGADERLTPEILEGFKVLFINLVSSGQPDFTADEIDTIVNWVEQGGGLFVIADHTNVYYHAERINPFLTRMGIEVTFHTALDSSPSHAISGGAWLKIQEWNTDHPVSQGLKIASFQTGGPVETSPEGTVATLSDNGFGDFWVENPDDPGFYGNWRLEEGEPTGRLPVVAATEFGQGRVAVVGDQNIFGDEWLLTAHNLELASNITEWLAKNEGNPDALRDQRDPEGFHVGIPLLQSDWNIGVNFCSGFFPFYINFNRTPSIYARGIVDIDDSYDAMVLTDPINTFTDEELATFQSYLDGGKALILMADLTRARAGSLQLLNTLAADLTIQAGDATLTPADLPNTESVETITSTESFLVQSPHFDVDGLRMAGHQYAQGQICINDIDTSTHYLHKVTSSWGEPFLQATLPDGTTVDLARRMVTPSGGQLILFIQDGFWRNETLGKERTIPTLGTADAHEIQYRFLDWLKTQKN